ncbi:MAG TPA: nuclear transport factor 2 family protein [Solirubrobacteraceae bacterium]|jgi:ketosteroid isomerase-like protein|nr:nuclear transport factor 2 family protein [Solirubrobacteraceae bacterium]
MYAWAVGRVIRRQFARLSAGDWRRPFARFGSDAVLRFPGDHGLAGEFRGRPAIRDWFERTWSLFDMAFTVDAVAVAGPPWDMEVSVRWRNQPRTGDGRVFPNRGMSFIRVRWGRVVEDELYEDTQVLADAVAHAEILAAARATAGRPTGGTSARALAPSAAPRPAAP